MLIIAGLGLYDLRDLSIGALRALKRASKVFVEMYTSIVPGLNFEKLEELVGKRVEELRRSDLEGEGLDRLVSLAEKEDVALLVPGDPFLATTHIIVKLEAMRRGVRVEVFHAPSILNAVLSSTGLQVYKFGRPVTIVKPTHAYRPTTPYRVLAENLSRGLHTLFFLDLKLEEGYAMTALEGIRILREFEEELKNKVVGPQTPFIVVARAASPDELVKVLRLGERAELGPPPHTLIVPGILNPVEIEALEVIANADRSFLEEWNRFVKSLMEFR